MHNKLSRIKAFLRQAQYSIQVKISPLFTGNRFLSALYYCLFDSSFWYEQQAVLKGKVHYNKNKGLQIGSSALLRRNVHRIEKGLIMQPRRSVFALDYIHETIDIYDKCRDAFSGFHCSELEWASDVLTEYFSVVDHNHPQVIPALNRFINYSNKSNKGKKVPYLVTEKEKHSVTQKQLEMLFKARRSVRWYQQKEVPNSLILSAIEMSLQAPSACNRQPFEFYVIKNKEKLSALSRLPGGTAGFSDNIPCLIAILGDLSCYPFERDRHVIYIDSSLVAMQFMLALESMGLSSCPLNWPELHRLDQRVSQLLDIPQHKRVVMFLSLGFAEVNGNIAFSEKKSVSQVVSFIK